MVVLHSQQKALMDTVSGDGVAAKKNLDVVTVWVLCTSFANYTALK